MEIQKLNKVIELKTLVSIEPSYMDNDIFISLMDKLKRKVEGKCFGEYGYVYEVTEIIDYEENIIQTEDLSGNCIFEVTFLANVFLPLRNEVVVCYIDNVSQELIRCRSGPLDIFIPNDRINNLKFKRNTRMELLYKLNDDQYKQVNNKDFILVSIIDYLIFNGQTIITTNGYLEDMATEEHINMYYTNEYKET